MSAQEAEVTERFEGFGDRAPFQPPIANEDIKLNRFLFTAATLITPDIARDRPHMKAGGLNVYNPCLNQTKDFIRRGRITPLVMSQHVPIPIEDAPPNDSTYFNVPLEGDSLRGGTSPFEAGGMMSRLAYPGQQIMHILEGSSNGLGAGGGHRLGIVEIGTLKGHEYKLENMGNGVLTDKELWKIQKAIFPEYPNLPRTLRAFTQLVQVAIDENEGDIRSIAEEMYPSCIQFEGWAIRHIEQTHQNMAQAAVKGYAAPYEQIDLVVLDQLEMRREDEHYKRSAQQAAQPVDAASILSAVRQGSAEDRAAFQTMLLEVIKELRTDPVATAPGSVVGESTMAAAPIDTVDLTGERPAHIHHKTWEKMQREAGINSDPPTE